MLQNTLIVDKLDCFSIEEEDYSVKLDLSQLIIDELVTLINLSLSFLDKDYYDVKLPKLASLSPVDWIAPE